MSMTTKFENSPKEVSAMHTDELRDNFLLKNIMQADKLTLVYSHYDRMIIGGVKPVAKQLQLENEESLKVDYFLQNRELGIINIGGDGIVEVDGKKYELNKLDALYIGKGSKQVFFSSLIENNPASFYLLSAPAHHDYPTLKCSKLEADPVMLGDASTSNKRVIYKYIHEGGIRSCQLVMGLTILEEGSVWNSLPPHTHTRRMEVYFYFDVAEQNRVFHFMGEATETRHIVVANHEAVIAPPWSVHFGAGTANYGFIWGMAGENKTFSDMDPAPIITLQ